MQNSRPSVPESELKAIAEAIVPGIKLVGRQRSGADILLTISLPGDPDTVADWAAAVRIRDAVFEAGYGVGVKKVGLTTFFLIGHAVA